MTQKSEDGELETSLFSSSGRAFHYAHNCWNQILVDNDVTEDEVPHFTDDCVVNVTKNFKRRITPAHAYLTEIGWDEIKVELLPVYD